MSSQDYVTGNIVIPDDLVELAEANPGKQFIQVFDVELGHNVWAVAGEGGGGGDASAFYITSNPDLLANEDGCVVWTITHNLGTETPLITFWADGSGEGVFNSQPLQDEHGVELVPETFIELNSGTQNTSGFVGSSQPIIEIVDENILKVIIGTNAQENDVAISEGNIKAVICSTIATARNSLYIETNPEVRTVVGDDPSNFAGIWTVQHNLGTNTPLVTLWFDAGYEGNNYSWDDEPLPVGTFVDLIAIDNQSFRLPGDAINNIPTIRILDENTLVVQESSAFEDQILLPEGTWRIAVSVGGESGIPVMYNAENPEIIPDSNGDGGWVVTHNLETKQPIVAVWFNTLGYDDVINEDPIENFRWVLIDHGAQEQNNALKSIRLIDENSFAIPINGFPNGELPGGYGPLPAGLIRVSVSAASGTPIVSGESTQSVRTVNSETPIDGDGYVAVLPDDDVILVDATDGDIGLNFSDDETGKKIIVIRIDSNDENAVNFYIASDSSASMYGLELPKGPEYRELIFSGTDWISNSTFLDIVPTPIPYVPREIFSLVQGPTSTITGGENHFVRADAQGSNITITLEDALPNAIITVKRIDSVLANTITVDTDGPLIDGVATYVLTAQYESVMFKYDGTNWWVV